MLLYLIRDHLYEPYIQNRKDVGLSFTFDFNDKKYRVQYGGRNIYYDEPEFCNGYGRKVADFQKASHQDVTHLARTILADLPGDTLIENLIYLLKDSNFSVKKQQVKQKVTIKFKSSYINVYHDDLVSVSKLYNDAVTENGGPLPSFTVDVDIDPSMEVLFWLNRLITRKRNDDDITFNGLGNDQILEAIFLLDYFGIDLNMNLL